MKESRGQVTRKRKEGRGERVREEGMKERGDRTSRKIEEE